MKAFPAYEYQQAYDQMMAVGGMDLRDYFAASALNSMGHFYVNAISNEVIAAKCYEVADAMMEARK
jgi:hypothetical protein